jgi:TPP-dependent pyruvate/acetoin dehydrogenase alpha subunit
LATHRVEGPESNDPIAVMERYLTSKSLFSEEWKSEIVIAFQQELDVAIRAAEFERCGASA